MTTAVDAADRPAAAWRKFAGTSDNPSVEPIVKGWKKRHARPAYRLSGVDGLPYSLIAKHCRRDEARRTLVVYEDVLTEVPLRSPRLVGTLEDNDRFTWIFVEEVLGDEYSPKDPEHRRLSAHWLATLHAVASRAGDRLAEFDFLYDAESDRIREYLAIAKDRLRDALSNPALSRDDVATVSSMVDRCEDLESQWESLLTFCQTVPRTLVHGDYGAANMRVLDGGASLAVFDWEKCGWAVPALDLSAFLNHRVVPNISTYKSLVRPVWPEVSVANIRRLAYVGEVFRWIDAVRWESDRLQYEWIEGPMSRIRVYSAWLNQIREAAPWIRNGALSNGEWLVEI